MLLKIRTSGVGVSKIVALPHCELFLEFKTKEYEHMLQNFVSFRQQAPCLHSNMLIT
jgi:hypothetical protein